MSKKLRSLIRDIALSIRNPIAGMGLMVCGVFALAYPRLLDNPIAETVVLWQSVGSSLVVIGVTTTFRDLALLIMGDDATKRHQELTNEIKALYVEVSAMRKELGELILQPELHKDGEPSKQGGFVTTPRTDGSYALGTPPEPPMQAEVRAEGRSGKTNIK